MTLSNETECPQPIVDPDGDWVWMPVAVHATEVEAVAAARDTYSDLNPWKSHGREWMILRPADPENEDDQYLIDEWGCRTVGEPSKAGEGLEYWCLERQWEPRKPASPGGRRDS